MGKHIKKITFRMRIDDESTLKNIPHGICANSKTLSDFTKGQNPEWNRLYFEKCVDVIDTQMTNKENDANVVSRKIVQLQMATDKGGSLCVHVERDFTRNGKIPQNVCGFFGWTQERVK